LDLRDSYNFLQFWVGKYTGAWYSPPEIDKLVDKGQLSYYKKCFKKYGTGQRLDDALAPFKKKVPFTTNSVGFLSTPSDYMDLIDILCLPGGNPVTCPVINEDEITNRRNSQLIPNSITAPFAEEIQNWNYQLYPMVLQSGTLSYFSRPPAPFFSYTVVSGRVIVYNANASTQLSWGDDEVEEVLLETLSSIGINLLSAELIQWQQVKGQQNLMGIMKSR
jgi:hypothetical protein